MTLTLDRPQAFTFDEAKFRASTPYALEKTPLPGAFTTPAPRDFNPNAASPADLVRAGLLWKRPDAASPPAFRAAWDRVMSRTWRPEDRITPEFAVQTGKTHHLSTPPVKQADGTYLTKVWAGTGTRGGNWTTVLGYWRIPTVSKPAEAQGTEGGWNSASWIGIDGFFDSNDVLQAGIEQRVNAQGQASYTAWYEWFAPQQPNSPGYIWQTNITNFPVSPGQQVYCSVQYTNNKTSGLINFANDATGQHFAITLAPPPGASFSGQSVEWIMESPDGGEPISSMPQFSPVVFTSALGCGPNNASANPATGDILNLTDATGKTTLTATTVGNEEATITFTG